MKKNISLAIALLVLLVALTSCGKSGTPGYGGGGTKSLMALSQLSIGELVVVYFTCRGEAVWVTYPESIDYDSPNLIN